MNSPAHEQAEEFLNRETEFHLGFLPTEQSNPLTRHLDRAFLSGSADGVRVLQLPDRDVLAMVRRILNGPLFRQMADEGFRTVEAGGRIVFSGCGATGRLSILLESIWREFIAGKSELRRYAESVLSIMTGGDFALVRSVESFEDHQCFGRRQVADLGMGPADLLVAITEGGETSSVIGTVKEAADRGSKVFLLFNNPAELLRKRLVRCREVIEDPRVRVVDLFCGPMALAGSTRMQATTSEQLVAGAMLESIAAHLLNRPETDFATGFETVLNHLESKEMIDLMAAHIDFEAALYRRQGKVTYFAADYLLDIFTDTTERAPTFMLPPFRARGDHASPPSWAFVKNPLLPTRETWQKMLLRTPRCLDWKRADYLAMGVGGRLADNPPQIGAEDLYRMEVGNEPAPERSAGPFDAAVLVEVAGAPQNPALEKAFEHVAGSFRNRRTLAIASGAPDTPLHLLNHMALKLALNTISTGTMVKLDRVTGNWMSWVSVSNKKLTDRAIRLIAELSEIPYRDACHALFESIEAMKQEQWVGGEPPSPVQYTLRKLREKKLK